MSYFFFFTYKDFYLKKLIVLLLMDLAYFFFLHRISPAFEKNPLTRDNYMSMSIAYLSIS